MSRHCGGNSCSPSTERREAVSLQTWRFGLSFKSDGGAAAGRQDPEELYLELAEKVREGLAHVDPYFTKLASGMEDWIACWRKLNPEGIPDIK